MVGGVAARQLTQNPPMHDPEQQSESATQPPLGGPHEQVPSPPQIPLQQLDAPEQGLPLLSQVQVVPVQTPLQQ